MCTLTFVPKSDEGFIITVNRDESPLRNAKDLSQHLNSEGKIFYMPREPLKGGTNVAINPDGRVSVLLNGAFQPHKMGGTYRESRGIILLNSLDFENIFRYTESSSFDMIEPFTLVEFKEKVREIRWDGEQLWKKELSLNEPLLWASAQLYSEEFRVKRQRWFEDMLKYNVDADSLLDFHLNGGEGNTENDMVMNRGNMVRTVSITQFSYSEGSSELKHLNLLDQTEQIIGNL